MSDYSSPVDYSQAAVNKALSGEQKLALLNTMLRIRRFELTSLKYYNLGRMAGFLHLYNGQEAVATGCISLRGPDDHFITGYRDHGHALAVGMGMNECMAEMFGKATGCSKGKGGSMHFFAPDKNYWGGHGIVAGQTPLGLGLGYALKYQGKKGCSLSFLGDGAVNQGAFHESLNLASLFQIPAIFVIENNRYSMGTSQERSSAYNGCLAQRAEAYSMDWDVIDGSDIYEVRAKVDIAMQRAREESKPTLLEISTYRYYGHSVADANAKKYRTAEEIERYKNEHDPIRLFERRLLAEGVLTPEVYAQMDEQAKQEAVEAARFADESPAPTVADIMTDVYWEVDNNTEASRQGTIFFNS